MTDSAASMLGRLAHDLRGPLSPLRTAAHLLRSGDIQADRQRELLDIIDRQTSRLSAMVQEVADWHRVEQGGLINYREVSNLPMLVELACGALRAGDHALAVDAHLAAGLDEVWIDGDAQRLVQMLGTLIAYAQSLATDADVEIRGQPPSGGQVRLTIAPRTLADAATDGDPDAVFNTPQATPFDGGLGWRLMIANAIATAHDASLSAGPGGVVEVRLPVA